MKFFEKRVQPRTRIRIQIRFGTDREWQNGFITDVSNTGVAILCRQKPVTRVISLQLEYQGSKASLACEVRWTESVDIRGRNLTHMGLKIISAPLDYLEMVQDIEKRFAEHAKGQPDTGEEEPENPPQLETLNL